MLTARASLFLLIHGVVAPLVSFIQHADAATFVFIAQEAGEYQVDLYGGKRTWSKTDFGTRNHDFGTRNHDFGYRQS